MSAKHNSVLVLDTNKQQLNPVGVFKAKRLLETNKAAVFRKEPFTIILKHVVVTDKNTKANYCLKVDIKDLITEIAILDNSKESIFKLKLDYITPRKQPMTRKQNLAKTNRRDKTNDIEQTTNANNIVIWIKRLIKLSPVDEVMVNLTEGKENRKLFKKNLLKQLEQIEIPITVTEAEMTIDYDRVIGVVWAAKTQMESDLGSEIEIPDGLNPETVQQIVKELALLGISATASE